MNKREKSSNKQGNISRQKYLWIIATFTLVGVISGYAYYALVGCNIEGGCAIKSNPYLMMIWGGLMGYLIPDMFLKPRNEEQNPAAGNQ
jgi:uncharacterized membrane protein YhaH (DUF805 family)